MSDILDLAQTFRAKSEKQAASISQSAAREYEQHAAAIRKCLNESVITLQADIQESHKRLRSQILSGWLWMAGSVLLLLALSSGVLFLSGMWITNNIETIAQQRATLQTLSEVEGLQVWRDKDGDRLTLLLPKKWEGMAPFKDSKTGQTVIAVGTKKALEI